MVRLAKTPRDCHAEILLKLESLNPCKSVKDRIARAMLDDAESRGLISPERTTLVEATSGNTGIALAFAAAARGYKLILTVPRDASRERRQLLRALGAHVELVDSGRGMQGPIGRAEEIAAELEDSYVLQQFENPANPKAHYETTGPEIWDDVGGEVDALVAGVGTGGTITGAGKYLKERNPSLELVAVEPAESPVLSGGLPGFHQIEGIGAGFAPAVLDRALLSEVIRVSSLSAVEEARRLASESGLLLGISSGAAVHAALSYGSRPENAGKRIVVIAPSSGERYLSTVLFNSLWRADASVEDRMPPKWQREIAEERGATVQGPW